MLKLFKSFIGLFSPYVNSFERKVDKFFRKLKSTDSFSKVKKRLIALMEEDLVVTSVWLEKKFKGYKYLNKRTRRKMYADVKVIEKKLQEFSAANPVKIESLKRLIENKGLTFPSGDEDKLKYIYQIMSFLRPGFYYKYIRTASFGKLLRNPDEQKMEGDCNQIVTFYIYLFSLKFPIEDLQIKLLPEHVCLHFRSIDIEATNGTFQKYTENLEVLPVTEIVSTNLLDLTDFREDVQSISPRTMVKSAQLAYAISSLKSLVEKNLNIAYNNLAVDALNKSDFKTAIFYLSKSGDREALKRAYHSASVYYLKNENFPKAFYYANQGGDNELKESIRHNEGIYEYRRGSLDKAIKIFRELGDKEMEKACYGKQYNELVKKVVGVKTLEEVKRKKSVYQKMLRLAQKMEDSVLEKGIRDTLSQI